MLSTSDIATYRRDGILVLPDLFSVAEVDALNEAFERDARIPGAHRILEPDDGRVRAVYASHQRQPEYAALTRSSRLLGAARQLLAPDLYLYQFKINAKSAFGGESWAWHQDFLAWQLADNVTAPHLINALVFLDEVNEFNGPLVLIPGSHTDGGIRSGRNEERRSEQHLDPADIAVPHDALSALVGKHGMVSAKGGPGTVVFFHPEIVHGSSTNMSPFPRRIAIATYNETANAPRPIGTPRPEHLVSRDTTPLVVEDDLIAAGAR